MASVMEDKNIPFLKAYDLYNALKNEFKKTKPNIQACSRQLTELKIALTHLSFLPNDRSSQSEQEVVLARDVLEIGAQISILRDDTEGFCRYMSQLKPYYLDYSSNKTQSPYRHELLGLNLLCLLSQNRVAEFHTELERLTTDDIMNSVYITHPISIEQYLMEGNYNKLFLAKGNVPAKSYSYFMDKLLKTIRSEIADCMEKSYDNIQIEDARRLLYFDSKSEFESFMNERNSKKKVWRVGPKDTLEFIAENECVSGSLPSIDLAKQMLGYACELETIV